jgi:hypothetical protein
MHWSLIVPFLLAVAIPAQAQGICCSRCLSERCDAYRVGYRPELAGSGLAQ